MGSRRAKSALVMATIVATALMQLGAGCGCGFSDPRSYGNYFLKLEAEGARARADAAEQRAEGQARLFAEVISGLNHLVKAEMDRGDALAEKIRKLEAQLAEMGREREREREEAKRERQETQAILGAILETIRARDRALVRDLEALLTKLRQRAPRSAVP